MTKKSLIAIICLLAVSQTALAFFQNPFNTRQQRERQRQRHHRQNRYRHPRNRRPPSRYRRSRTVANTSSKPKPRKTLPTKIKKQAPITDEVLFAEFKKPNDPAPANGVMITRTFTQQDKALHYTLTVKYPQLGGAPTFNKTTERMAYTSAYQFKKTLEQLAQKKDRPIPKELENSLLLTYDTPFENKNLISIKFTFNRFIAGQAHPTPSYKSLNFDLKNGKALELDQLFQQHSSYLETLSEYCKQTLTNRKISDRLWIKEGTKPSAYHYQIWNITKQGLVITFPPFQVAPYSKGPQHVTIPFTFLSSKLSLNFSALLMRHTNTASDL